MDFQNVQSLPVSTHTAAQAAAALGCELGKIAKSLVFYNVGNNDPILIIASGANRVDKEKVGKYLGFKIKTAGPEYVLEKTGFAVGGVPPTGHKSPIRTLMDKDLMKYDQIWASAGTVDSLYSVNPTELAKVAKAELIDV